MPRIMLSSAIALALLATADDARAAVGAADARAAVEAAAAPAAAPVVLAAGHVDYAARFVDGTLRSQVKDGTQGTVAWREPTDVVFHVRPQARTAVPDDPRLAFLGAPGDPVWLIPQVERAGILWAGWNTQEIRAGDLAGPVTWRLTAVEGPGAVALYQVQALAPPDVLFNTRDGLPDAREVQLGTHAHGNWAFSAEGVYRLTFEMSGTRPSGEPVGDTEVLTVVVGGTDPGTVPPPGGNPAPPPPGPDAPPAGRGVTLRASAARVRGRVLTIRVRLGVRSRVAVAVRRRGRTVARARERTVAAGTRTLRLRLGRRLGPGRYEVRVRARAGGGAVTRTLRLRVRRRAPVATAAQAAGEKVTLDDGHVDYAARMVGGRLESHVKDGTRGADRPVWRDPADVTFELGAAARSTVPDDEALRFLGEPGDPVWMIPQVQKSGVLWAGWNTEELDDGDLEGGVTWRLAEVDGPGDVVLFGTGSFGEPEVLFDSADGLPDAFEIPLGTHAHGNWAFRARGTYRLTFEMSGRRPSGEEVRDRATLTVKVAGAGGAAAPSDQSESGTTAGGGSDGQEHAPESASGGAGDLPDTGAALAPRVAAGLLLLLAGLRLKRL